MKRSVGLFAAVLSLGFWLTSTQVAQGDESKDRGEKTNLFEALQLRGVSQNLQGKDLTAAWRLVAPQGESATEDFWRWVRLLDGDVSPNRGTVFCTRGETIEVNGESYLIAYAPDLAQDDKEREARARRARIRRREGPQSLEAFSDFKIAEEDVLRLALLNLRASGSLRFIAFDPEKHLLTEKDRRIMRAQADRAQSQSNLKQLMLGLKQYLQDYDEMYPPMRAAKDADSLRQALKQPNKIGKSTPVQVMLWPYLKSVEVYFHPTTKRPYLPNWRISRKSLASIANASEVIAFYEDAPDAEGFRNVAFVDGHVKAFPEVQWQRMREAAKIPP